MSRALDIVVAVEKQSECVYLGLVIQHAKRMRRIFICDLPVSAIFFNITHKHHDFRKIIEYKMCVLIFLYNFWPKYFSFCEEMSGIWLKMFVCLHVKYPLFILVRFQCKLNFHDRFSKKNYSNIKFNEIRPAGAEMFHADRRTDWQAYIERQRERWRRW